MITVIAGPGGVGKGTLVRELLRRDPALWLSRSWTSRAPRPGDPNDEKYVFVDRAAFEARIAAGGFLEWAEFTGNYYGTPTLEAPPGRDVVLEIEMQGAQQIRARHPDALLVFLLPPSREEQERRLRRRGDTEDKVAERIRKAAEEEPIGRRMADHIVVNDDLDGTVDALASIVRAERRKRGMAPGSPRRLPRRDVLVSAFGFGGTIVGNSASPAGEIDALAAVDAAWELGVRYFHTSPWYGHGRSERRLGAALRGRARDELAISIGVGRGALVDVDEMGGASEPAAGTDLSAGAIQGSLAASLDRLGFDHVDVVFLDAPDYSDSGALDEAVSVLTGWRAQGVIGAVGVVQHDLATLTRLVGSSDLDVVLRTGPGSPADRVAFDELLDRCLDHGVGVVVALPAGAPLDATLQAIGARHGADGRAVALQLPLRHDAVVSVLVDVASEAGLRADASRLSTPLPALLWAEVEVSERGGATAEHGLADRATAREPGGDGVRGRSTREDSGAAGDAREEA